MASWRRRSLFTAGDVPKGRLTMEIGGSAPFLKLAE
jgi:hypothetical protein